MKGQGWPQARAGMRVGLLGGSFDPAHAGHVHITRAALKRFGLDRVWWLVSPGNPLKEAGPAPFEKRLSRARAVLRDAPQIEVTDLEYRLGTRFSFDTIRAVQRCYPGVQFSWLMGADNLADFHRWDHWRGIFHACPIGVMARPGDRLSARMSVAARQFRRSKLPSGASQLLGGAQPPVWCFVNVPMRADSSTALRAAGGWPGPQIKTPD